MKRDQGSIRAHYEVERELADRLREAPASERRRLYASIYEELYRRVPDHPQIVRKASAEETARSVRRQMAFLRRYLRAGTVFLEVGAGSCALSIEASRCVAAVYAVDVNDAISARDELPENVRFVLSDGCGVPVPEGSVDVAYSHQLMEHLHPDDALEQLGNVYRTLKAGGVYICATPNRLNGPHDISKYFDTTASGFHLKEYTITEMAGLFERVGFSKVQPVVGGNGVYSAFLLAPLVTLERCLGRMPSRLRRRLAASIAIRPFLGIRIVGHR